MRVIHAVGGSYAQTLVVRERRNQMSVDRGLITFFVLRTLTDVSDVPTGWVSTPAPTGRITEAAGTAE